MPVRVGVVFPQTEIGADPGAIREFAQAVEQMGYTHLLVYDHVVGAHPDRLAGLGVRPPYTYQSSFHEPFVLYGYLAAVTRTLELATGIIILPQRQTVLVAKQAAEVDVLSGGRLRLGVGLGWNPVEYEALGQAFVDRGRRISEQVVLLRRLWTEEVVDFSGRYHTVRGAGLNPLPVQRPIPIWMGGSAEPALRRIARLADGWIPEVQSEHDAEAAVSRMRQLVAAAGRDPHRFGIEGRVRLARTPQDRWGRAVHAWKRAGATHLSVDTMRAGCADPHDHLAALESFRRALA